MKHRILVLSLLLAAAVSQSSALAAAPAAPRSVLTGVAALDQPVTYTETKIPLSELVQKVAADTGVPLTAAASVADEPVAVVVKELPARDLLEQLADLLDYQWSRRTPAPEPPTPNTERRTPTYEITQDLAARSREAALRERRLREVEARFREELQLHAAMAALPSDAFQRLLAAAADRSRQKQTPEQIASRFRTAEGREQMRHDEAVHALQSPAQRTLALLVNQLPAEQWDRLRAAGRLTLSTHPGPGELPLPGEIARLLRSSGPIWRTEDWWQEPPTSEDEASDREDDRRMQEAWAAEAGYRVTLDWETHPLTWRSGLHFAARVTPLRGAILSDLVGRPGAMLFSSPGAMLFLDANPMLAHDPDPELTPGQRAALAKDPVMGAVAQCRPDPKAAPTPGGPVAGEKYFQEYLPELARLYHVAFLADAYWSSPRLGRDALPTEPTALYALLERLLGATHRWDRRDRLLRLRSRTWFMERPCEVPLRLVRQWNDLTARNGALSLDTFAQCAATLSDGQMDYLNYLIEVAGISKDFTMVPGGRQGLRLYATLTPGQRQALWLRQPVALVRITPAQRALLVAALREGYRDSEWTGSPEQLTGVSLSLEDTPLIRVRQQRGATITEQEFPPGAPELVPSAGPNQAAPPAGGSAKAVTITRHPVARVTLSIHYDLGWTGPPSLIVSPP